MSQAQKDYQAMIKAYLSKQLSEQELAEFEVRLLEDQDLFREVQRMEAMQDHLQSHSGRLSADGDRADAKPGGWLQAWRQWFTQPQSVFACLLLLVAFVLPVLQQSPQPSAPAGDTGIQEINNTVTLQNFRSTDRQYSVRSTPPVLISVDAGPNLSPGSPASYRLQILHAREQTLVLERTGLQRDNEGLLRVVLQEELTGEYQITIQSGDGQYQNSYIVDFVESD